MAVVSNSYTGNGSTTTYSFTFPYLNTADVKVKVNGTTQNTTSYTLPTATTLQFNTAPSNGSTILIFRDTNNDAKKATFYPGSAIKAEDLNNDFDQILYTAQEVDAFAFTTLGDDAMQGDLDIGNNKITNLGTPTAGTDGVNKTYVDTNTWDITTDTYTSSETWTGNNTTIATSGAIDARIDSKVDTAIEGDVLVGTDLAKSASSGQVTISHNVTGADSTVNNSNGNVLQDITVTAQGHVTSVGSTDLDGRYYTETELNAGQLDNRYYTETELNAGQLDNRYYTETEVDANFYKLGSAGEIASGEAWSAADNKIATTAAIDARITDLVDDVGGFVPIDNETSFPNTNPDVNNGAGTLVSIKALSSNITSNGSGVATIANGTVGNSTVTINGLANSTTYNATYGMIVETTSTLNTYTFHRLVPKATEVTTVAGNITNINAVANNATNINTVAGNNTNINTVAGNNSNVTTVAGISSNVTSVAGNETNINAVNSNSSNINTVAGAITNVNTTAGSIANVNTVATNISSVNDFSDVYRISSSDPSSHLHTGDLVFNTTSNELRVYNGSAWQGGVTATGDLLAKSGGQMTGNITFSGSQTVDGRDVSADGTKLDGIESNATADMTGAQIKTAYEAESDTNAYTDAEKTKLSGIAASADQNVQSDWNASSGDAVILNKPTIPSAYTHPNHSGEVTSTGDGATVIADNVVDEANLKVSNSPTNGYALTAQSGNTGGLTWADISASPGGSNTQLQYNSSGSFGGISALTTDGTDITFVGTGGMGGAKDAVWDASASALAFDGWASIRFNSTFQIYKGDGANDAPTILDTSGNAMLMALNGGIEIRAYTTGEKYIKATENGATELYYDGTKRIETSNTGVTITGTATATTFSGSGASLTTLNASNISSGTVATARLGSGTASSSTFLRGDGSWAAAGGGTTWDSTDSNLYTATSGNSSGGGQNISLGNQAGYSLASGGYYNTFLGYRAGLYTTTGDYNIGISDWALSHVTTGSYNLGLSSSAGKKITTGSRNISIGPWSMSQGSVTGNDNLAIGNSALYYLTSGSDNVAVGTIAGEYLTTANNSTFVGRYAGNDVTTGSYNAFFGAFAGQKITTSEKNTCLGGQAGMEITTGGSNTCIGYNSGYDGTTNLTTGSNNILIGHGVTSSSATVSNEITLGDTNITKFRIPGINFELADNGGTPANGTVLTMASGGATWAAVAGGVSSDAQLNTVGGTDAGDFFDANSTYNTAFGYEAMKGGGGASVSMNTAIGYRALRMLNSSAGDNTAVGAFAGYSLSSGEDNTFIGKAAGYSLSSGNYNIAIGEDSFGGTCTGNYNIGIGKETFDALTSGTDNIAIGRSAANNATTGGYNNILGRSAGYNLTTGTNNTILGNSAATNLTTGTYNVAIGDQALAGGSGSNVTGGNNIAIGNQAGYDISSGELNTCIGYSAGANITTSNHNTCLGREAGNNITTGASNLVLGTFAAASSATVSNEITLGDANISTLRCQVTSITALSDRRDKTDINTLDLGLNFINALNPVKFKWNSREGILKDGSYEAGFIAQDFQESQKDFNAEYLNLVLDTNPEKLEAAPGKLIPIMVQAIKELSAKVKALEAA